MKKIKKSSYNGFLILLRSLKNEKILVPKFQSSNTTVSQHFFQPLIAALTIASHTRNCPKLSDEEFLRIGVLRCTSQSRSGRDFLQCHGIKTGKAPSVGHYFDSLTSQRRLSLCGEVNEILAKSLPDICSDPLGSISELDGFTIFAGDGHYHSEATHDRKPGDRSRPVGHFFLLNLRTHGLHHLETGLVGDERKIEHDMHALKRVGIPALRMGEPKGRKVLYVWDKAGIDFRFWHQAKHGSGVYFISREKDKMKLVVTSIFPVDTSDPRNSGIVGDELVETSNGVCLRRVTYYDVVENKIYNFLTTLTDAEKVPPGVIALLYKCRWQIEKTFDESKNKLEERKAWATSLTAKSMQARFICITHNLLMLIEKRLVQGEEIQNERELKRRADRLAMVEEELEKRGYNLPWVHSAVQCITVIPVKLIRWLRCLIYEQIPWGQSVDRLRKDYVVF